MNTNLEKYTKRFIMTVQVSILLITLAGLSSCKKAADSENSSKEAILEQEGNLEIIVPEDEETFGE